MQRQADARQTPTPEQPRPLSDLPGPRGLPWVGQAWRLRPDRLHLQLEAWGRQFGPCYQFRFGPRTILVVSGHATIQTLLRDRPERFRRPLLGGRIAREMGFDEGLFFANDETWQRQRRMVMAGLDPGHVKAYFPTLLNVTLRLRTRWKAAAHNESRIDLQADLMRFTVDASAGLAFGMDVNTLESDDDVIQRHLNRIFPKLHRRGLALLPYWRYVRLPSDRALDRSVCAVQQAIRGFIADARQRLQRDPSLRERPRNLLEAMICAADRADSDVNDHDVAGNVIVLLLAGEDTTANTLAWMIELLHRHPHALERARAEVRRLAPDPAGFTPEQMASLDYLDACIQETMRLKPVAPLLLVQAVSETTVADVLVPADTVVFALMRHDSLDAREFPDPTAFKPERWLSADPAAPNAASKRISMPFGAGPRICPGRYLALLEMKMAMAMLLGCFGIETVAPTAGGATREHLSFSMGPVGLHMRLRPLHAEFQRPAADVA
ncbi:MAG: cytochrome P450 [Burkholderiales bacterium]|nr:cytochrome P450 [Burkholderiales bacterium]